MIFNKILTSRVIVILSPVPLYVRQVVSRAITSLELPNVLPSLLTDTSYTSAAT